MAASVSERAVGRSQQWGVRRRTASLRSIIAISIGWARLRIMLKDDLFTCSRVHTIHPTSTKDD